MIASLRRRRRGYGEQGATLIIALAFITMLGPLIVGLLALTDANFKATQVTRSRTDALYTADGAADVALEQIRTTANTGVPTDDLGDSRDQWHHACGHRRLLRRRHHDRRRDTAPR